MVLIEADVDVNSEDEEDGEDQREGKGGGAHEQSVLFFNDDARQKRVTGQFGHDAEFFSSEQNVFLVR
jgi:hypothetical protein